MRDAGHLYLLHGMKRSGNHAVINWLLPQTGAAFFNNLIPVAGLLRSGRMPPQPFFPDWRAAMARHRGGALQRILASLEDHDLRTTPFTGIDLPTTPLLVLRDARQVFSSRLRKAFRVEMPAYPRSNDAVMQRAVGLWKQHARSYLDPRADLPGRVAILFDAWVAQPGYRAAISATLGLAFDDAGFGQVSEIGGGSSFDGVAFAGRGQEMAVGDRVSALDPRERDLLDALFRDRELDELAAAVRASDPLRQLRPAVPG